MNRYAQFQNSEDEVLEKGKMKISELRGIIDP